MFKCLTYTLVLLSAGPGLCNALAAPSHDPAYDRVLADLLALWDGADVVALGESHGSKLDSDLRIRLVRHPEFARRVDVILVEFANAHRQDTLDLFVSGEEVERSALVKVWRDTGSEVWNSPIYEAFLTAVREVNQALRADERIRVLAGDQPIDWSEVRSGEDLIPFLDRGGYPAPVVDCEILDKGLKGLIIYGTGHLYHHDEEAFVATLDKRYPGRVVVVEGTHWPEASVARLRDTFGLSGEPQLVRLAGTPVADWDFHQTIGFGEGHRATLGQALDALAYYGDARDETVAPSQSSHLDADYRAWLKRRDALMRDRRRATQARGWEFGDEEKEKDIPFLRWKRYCD